MLKNIYIISILFSFIAFSCAPSKHFRNTNIISNKEKSRDSFFSWSSSDEKNNDYEDFNGIEYYNDIEYDNEYKSKTQVFSRNNKNNINSDKNRVLKRKNNEIAQQKYARTQEIIRYKVKKSDTLYKISEKYNLPVIELININNIKNEDKIFEGMIIRIPVKRITTKSDKENSFKNNAPAPPFIWPMKNIYNTKRDDYSGVKPIGIIITGKPGNDVLSSADGIIEKIGYMRGFGHYIIITHANKYLTTYSNLGEIDVAEGNRIKSGQILGKVSGNRLHFQIGHSGRPEDPLVYLSKRN